MRAKLSIMAFRNKYPVALPFVVLCTCIYTSPAFAYIDPNTGGYIFQLLAPLVAILTSLWIFCSHQVKALWRSIIRFLKRQIKGEK